jgi:hypothetical protein
MRYRGLSLEEERHGHVKRAVYKSGKAGRNGAVALMLLL